MSKGEMRRGEEREKAEGILMDSVGRHRLNCTPVGAAITVQASSALSPVDSACCSATLPIIIPYRNENSGLSLAPTQYT